MDYKEVKKVLKKGFTDLLIPFGFKALPDTQGCTFYKELNNVRWQLGYGIVNYVDEFSTGLFGSITIKPIENVENQIFNEVGKRDTVLLQISKYFDDINYQFKIKSEDDIKEWMQIASNFYNEFAESFFERYKTVADIDKLLNTNPRERVPELNDLGSHIIVGLISAKLNENPNYEELRSFYRSEVEEKFNGHFMYDTCMQVIHFLDNHSLDKLKILAEPTPST